MTVKVRRQRRLPAAHRGRPIQVGAGAGVPVADATSVWVPLTVSASSRGSTPRPGASRADARRHREPGGGGFLDSATTTDGSIWSASDAAARSRASTLPRGPRPRRSRPAPVRRPDGRRRRSLGFGFQGSEVTRVDASTGAVRTLNVDGASAAGIAYGDGALWVLSLTPARILEVDPASGAVRAAFPLKPPFAAGVLADRDVVARLRGRRGLGDAAELRRGRETRHRHARAALRAHAVRTALRRRGRRRIGVGRDRPRRPARSTSRPATRRAWRSCRRRT